MKLLSRYMVDVLVIEPVMTRISIHIKKSTSWTTILTH